MGTRLSAAGRAESGVGGLPLRAVMTHRISGCLEEWLVPEPPPPLPNFILRPPDLRVLAESFLSTAGIWVILRREGKFFLVWCIQTQGKHLSFCGLWTSVPAILSAWKYFSPLLNTTSSGKSHLIAASRVRQKLCYECPEHPLWAVVNLLVSVSVSPKGWHWACGVIYTQVFSTVPSAQKVSAPNEIA